MGSGYSTIPYINIPIGYIQDIYQKCHGKITLVSHSSQYSSNGTAVTYICASYIMVHGWRYIILIVSYLTQCLMMIVSNKTVMH